MLNCLAGTESPLRNMFNWEVDDGKIRLAGGRPEASGSLFWGHGSCQPVVRAAGVDGRVRARQSPNDCLPSARGLFAGSVLLGLSHKSLLGPVGGRSTGKTGIKAGPRRRR